MTRIDSLVFDILGTMVDEPSGIRTALAEALPAAPADQLTDLAEHWLRYVERAQQEMATGARAYATSGSLDGEAIAELAAQAGLDDSARQRLATAGRRLPAWADSADGLAALAMHVPVLGLSNADRRTLLGLNAHAGLRWHLVLSADECGAYKPSPAVYRLAVDATGSDPDGLIMVAAHAWDLRGA